MDSTEYETRYDDTCERMVHVVRALAEWPCRTIDLAFESGGELAVQALFDAVLDNGHRAVLVQVLNTPKLPDGTWKQLVKLLYGTNLPFTILLKMKTLE
jgi:hypothetical protein